MVNHVLNMLIFYFTPIGAVLKVFPEKTAVQEEPLSAEDLSLAQHVRVMEQSILKHQAEARLKETK
jgi:hypothetical protein